MKKSTVLFIAFVATFMLLMVSCQDFFNEIRSSITTAVAKYIETQAGLEIKDFAKDMGTTPENAGLVDEDGNVPKSLTFNKPDKTDVGGLMSCNELPLDFVKISNEFGERKRKVAPSRYIGTWEAITPLPQGFRKIYLDLKEDGNCSIYFDIVPNDDVEIKTRKETVLQGSVTTEGGYALNINNSSTGYTKSIKRFAGRLEKVGTDYNTLVAKFKVAGQFNTIKLFELQSGDQIKGTYVGTGDFAEEKVGTKITFEIENNNFTLTIPAGTKLPKKFSK